MANEISNRLHAGFTCSLFDVASGLPPVLQQSWGVDAASLRRRLDLSASGAAYTIDLSEALGGRTDGAGQLVECAGILTWSSVGVENDSAVCQLATADVPENTTSEVLLGPYPPDAQLSFTQILIAVVEELTEFDDSPLPLLNVQLVRIPR